MCTTRITQTNYVSLKYLKETHIIFNENEFKLRGFEFYLTNQQLF